MSRERLKRHPPRGQPVSATYAPLCHMTLATPLNVCVSPALVAFGAFCSALLVVCELACGDVCHGCVASGHVAPVQKPMLRACALCHVVESTSFRSRTWARVRVQTTLELRHDGDYFGGVAARCADV